MAAGCRSVPRAISATGRAARIKGCGAARAPVKLASLPTALSNFFPKDASGSTQATKGAEPSRARRNLTQLGRAEGSELAGHEPRTRRKRSDELFFFGGSGVRAKTLCAFFHDSFFVVVVTGAGKYMK